MKKITLAILFLLVFQTITAQVLYSEDFDNYTIGDLGLINILNGINTTPNPPVSGQGSWFITEAYNAPYINSFEAKIEPEPNRGNVLTIKDIPQATSTSSEFVLSKVLNSENSWIGRNTGNDVLKFEYDFYTGNLGTGGTAQIALSLGKANNAGLNLPNNGDIADMISTIYVLDYHSTMIRELFLRRFFTGNEIKRIEQPPINTWIKINMYIDYISGYLFLELPSINLAIRTVNPVPVIPDAQGNALQLIDHITITYLSDVTSDNGNRNPYFCKYDNFVMSAVNTLPLSLKKLAATTFNIFPNPVVDMVTITNSENFGIEQIEVFDMSASNQWHI